jgi:electron transport complex protein RnfG
VKKDYIMPILVLSVICLIVSGALAAGNNLTAPIIEQAAAERAEAARKEILPDADEFVPLHAEGFPKSIDAAYGTSNGIGYIFMVTSVGYGGDIKMVVGISPEGRIIKTAVLSHTETQGLGTVIFDRAREYEGKDGRLEGIDAVSGSTITFNAYRNGVRDAFAAFEIVKGGF